MNSNLKLSSASKAISFMSSFIGGVLAVSEKKQGAGNGSTQN